MKGIEETEYGSTAPFMRIAKRWGFDYGFTLNVAWGARLWDIPTRHEREVINNPGVSAAIGELHNRIKDDARPASKAIAIAYWEAIKTQNQVMIDAQNKR